MSRAGVALAALLAACGSTTTDVRSGRAWDNARPADYRASREDVIREVESYLATTGYRIEYAEADKSFLKAYRAGTSVTEQNIEVHVRIAAGTAEGTTRVTAISGRSMGVEWAGRHVHDRLHEHLRATFK